MADPTIQKKMDDLAEAVLFADSDDPQCLAQLHHQLEDIIEWAGQADEQQLGDVVSAAAGILEAVILHETDDEQTALQTVSDTITELQNIILTGRDFSEASIAGTMGTGGTGGAGGTGGGGQEQGHPDVSADSTIERDDESSGDPPVDQEIGASNDTEDTPAGRFTVELPPHVDEKIFGDFLARQESVLEEMEHLLLGIEQHDTDKNLAEYKRMIHTLKGESGLLGLASMESLCHAIEDALAQSDPVTLVDTLLKIKDWLGRAFAAYAGNGSAPEPVDQWLTALSPPNPPSDQPVADVSPHLEPAEPAPVQSSVAADDHQPAQEVKLTGDPDLIADFIHEAREHLENCDVLLLEVETDPTNVETLNGIFRGFHTIKGVAGFLDLPQIQQLSHESETLLDKARKADLMLEGPTLDVVFDAVDRMRKLVDAVHEALNNTTPLVHDAQLDALLDRIHRVASGAAPQVAAPQPPPAEPGKKLGEILVDRGVTTPDAVEAALQIQQTGAKPAGKVGQVLVQEGHVAAKDVARAIRSQKNPQSPKPHPAPVKQIAPPPSPRRQDAAAPRPVPSAAIAKPAPSVPTRSVAVKQTVKVDAIRLDALVDAIGELVIAEAMVNQASTHSDTTGDLPRMFAQLNKITRELQEMATSLRMVPVRSTFQKMQRLARDTSKKLNKRIQFVMTGEDTELDKSVVDKIGDPLVHMVRNAVDHGIESSSQVRREAGKPEAGRVELKAFHQGGSIYIEIHDDGRGLDRDVLLKKAIEKGLIAETDQLTDTEVFNLVLEPGFSTAEQVTDVSGRGVGMDVVRRNIESLRGRIEIRSELGKGSIFSIKLPLTMAIIDGMVVRVGSQRYIIPTLSIVRMLRPDDTDFTCVFDRGQMLTVGDDLTPLYYLDQLFNVEDAHTDRSKTMVVVVENDDRKVGLVIDDLLDQQQIVIKSLGDSLKGVPGVAGGAIMPDGRVGLILDINGLVKLATSLKFQPAPATRAAA